MTKIKEIIKNIIKGTNEIIFLSELKQNILSKKKLNIKIGFDPTSPDIHLGHTILLNKAKKFQENGHKIIIIIGDFTGMIGDPSEKKNTRIQLSKKEVLINAKTYKTQIFKILKKNFTKIIFNSTWLNKITSENFIKLSSKQTVAKMLQREDFNKRYNNNKTIHIHEFLYPLIQAYDSIIINSNIELGGTDQKFNLLMGRDLQKTYNQKQQMIMTLPLLEGTSGINKMSKSLKNYIGINDAEGEIYGKLMSISDELMWNYLNLLNNIKEINIKKIKNDINYKKNKRDIKLNLSYKITKTYHGLKKANKIKKNFIEKYLKKNVIKIKEYKIKLKNNINQIKITSILKELNFTKSISESIRMIKQNALKINNKKINETNLLLNKNIKTKIELGKQICFILII